MSHGNRALIVIVILSLLPMGTAVRAHAESGQGKPINLALFNPVQIVPETEDVNGLRLSLLYGKNRNMTGLDVSLVGVNSGLFQGVQLGLVSWVEDGLQIGLLNFAKNGFLPFFPIFNFNFDD